MPCGTAVLVMAMDMPAIVEVYISFSYKLASTVATSSAAFCEVFCVAELFAATEAISVSLHSPQSLRPYSGHMRLSIFE